MKKGCMISILSIVGLIIVFIVFVYVTYSLTVEEKKDVVIIGTKVHARSYYFKERYKKATSINIDYFFDDDIKTGSDKDVSLKFYQPVYLESVEVSLGDKTAHSDSNKKEILYLKLAPNDDTFLEHVVKTKIIKGRKKYLIEIEDRMLELLRVGWIKIMVNDYNIQEITFTTRKKPKYVNTISLKSIETKYIKGKSKWQFAWSDSNATKEQAKLEEEVFLNLFSLGLQGDGRAIEIINSFSPTGTFDSEAAYEFERWFESTKKLNDKLINN